jgi:glutaredoxin 3
MTQAFMLDALIVLLVVLLLAFINQADGRILSTGEDVNGFIEVFIKEHDVMVFAKSYCPHCKMSKSIIDKLLSETRTQYSWNERFLYLDYLADDGPVIQEALLERTGQRTVPNIFIGGKHIGGNSDLKALYENGDLVKAIESIASSKSKS